MIGPGWFDFVFNLKRGFELFPSLGKYEQKQISIKTARDRKAETARVQPGGPRGGGFKLFGFASLGCSPETPTISDFCLFDLSGVISETRAYLTTSFPSDTIARKKSLTSYFFFYFKKKIIGMISGLYISLTS